MHFHFSFYSSLLLIFFPQGLLFAGLLWRKGLQEGRTAHYWLSAFLLLCTLYIMPWMLGHAGWYSHQPYRDILFYIPFQQPLLLGPLLFIYTKQVLNPGYRFSRSEARHLLLPAGYLLYSLVMLVTDKLLLQQPFFYADGHDRELDLWYQVAGMLSMSGYAIASLRYYRRYRNLLVQVVSFADTLRLRWIRHYLLAFLAMVLLDGVFLLLFPGWGSFTTKWWYYFTFAALTYFIALTAYTAPVQASVPFRLLHQGKRVLYLVGQAGERPLAAALPSPEASTFFTLTENAATIENTQPSESHPADLEESKAVIIRAMADDQAFRDPELTLATLSARTGMAPATLSKVINRGFGSNFNDFINAHRVEAVKRLLLSGAQQRQTLLGIAYDCGFNSKNTFNRAFRKHTGQAPSEYLKAIKPKPEAGPRILTPEKKGEKRVKS